MRIKVIVSTIVLAIALVACGKTTTNGGTVNRGIDATQGAKRSIVLTWDARTGLAADSFHIYGSESQAAAEVPLAVVAANTAGFDAKNPSFTLYTTDQAVQPFIGKTLCLGVSAVVAGIESGYSNLVCNKL